MIDNMIVESFVEQVLTEVKEELGVPSNSPMRYEVHQEALKSGDVEVTLTIKRDNGPPILRRTVIKQLIG